MARKNGKDRGICQRKGRTGWWVRLVYNGRERWHKCDTKSQAKALYGRLKADIREEKYFPEKFAAKQDLTLRAWMERCVKGSTNISKASEQHYSEWWGRTFGTRLLSEVTTEDLRHEQAKMRAEMIVDERTKQSRRRWADASINRYFAFVRRCFSLAVKDGKLMRNPVGGVTFFPESNRTRFLSDEELSRLKAHMDANDWKLVAFAIETGLRQGEQFPLRWEWVDLENSVLTIPMPKGKRTRHVPLSEGAKTILRSLDSFLTSPFVFAGLRTRKAHNGVPRPMDPRAFERRAYEPALHRAGIQGACWHTLRHTAASRRVMAGVDLFSVSKVLGHRDIKTTMRYAHLSPDHLRETINRGSLDTLGTVTKTVTTGISVGAGSVQPVELVVRPTGLEPVTF